MSERPPPAAIVLGLAGLLPLAAISALQLRLGHGSDLELPVVITVGNALGYAALILSFLGGTWWSAACNRLDGAALWRWLGLAVVPSLWAAASFLAGSPRGTAVMLSAGLLLALLADRVAVSAGLVPVWWMGLRAPLSCGLAVETIAVAWLA